MDSIDHIGIAVNSLAEAVPAFAALLGQNPSAVREVPAESVRVVFFGDAPGRLELLEPTDDDSPIARFLTRRGSGVHHVCLATPDLAAALRRAEAQGLEVIAPAIRHGADGTRVAFLHPRSTSGVLIELTERAP
ncbi:MAG: methylmalonyl-CoA epimerase [Gemmatimonadota bacterium]